MFLLWAHYGTIRAGAQRRMPLISAPLWQPGARKMMTTTTRVRLFKRVCVCACKRKTEDTASTRGSPKGKQPPLEKLWFQLNCPYVMHVMQRLPRLHNGLSQMRRVASNAGDGGGGGVRINRLDISAHIYNVGESTTGT